MNYKDSENQLTEDELELEVRSRAMRLLTRREHSFFELNRKLSKSAESAIIVRVINELASEGYQSDQRFAEMICRTRFNNGRGPVRIRHELQEHNVASETVEMCMSEYEDQWSLRAKEVRVQKFGVEPPRNFEEWAKQARFLQQRGFTREQIGNYSE